MDGVMAGLNETLSQIFISVSGILPDRFKPHLVLLLYTVVIAIYAIFVWRFYKFLARKNILSLNLRQYSKTEAPFLNKAIASLLYLVEYIIIVPILVFFWFSVLAIFLLLLSKTASVSHILIVTAAIVAATRITSYYTEDLSKDIAKMFPFTALAVFLLEPGLFSFDKILSRFIEIPELFGSVFFYLFFIVGLELIMRIIYTVAQLFRSEEEVSEVPKPSEKAKSGK